MPKGITDKRRKLIAGQHGQGPQLYREPEGFFVLQWKDSAKGAHQVVGVFRDEAQARKSHASWVAASSARKGSGGTGRRCQSCGGVPELRWIPTNTAHGRGWMICRPCSGFWRKLGRRPVALMRLDSEHMPRGLFTRGAGGRGGA